MDKPTAEDIHKAIWILETNEANPYNNGCTCEQCNALKTVIKSALEQIQMDPCEWCTPSKQENYKGVMPIDFITFMEFDGWRESVSKMGKHYCPNCGRDLRRE